MTRKSRLSIIGDGCTFTQVHSHHKLPLEPQKHGLNHDSVVSEIISDTLAYGCVSDGAGQLYWAEVASRQATKGFQSIIHSKLANLKKPQSAIIEEILVDSFMETNKHILDYTLPSGKRAGIFEEGGGQCTLVGCVLFYESGKWKCASLATGDSLSYLYKISDGTWRPLSKDEGTMLPFQGLEKRNLSQVVFSEIDPNDEILILMSDGVYETFPSKILPTMKLKGNGKIGRETLKEFKETVTREVFQAVSEGAEPDDVAFVAFSFEEKNEDKPNTSQVLSLLDITKELYPEFKSSIELPWGETYSY